MTRADGSLSSLWLFLFCIHPRAAAEELLWTNITTPSPTSPERRVAFLISGHERTFLEEWRSTREHVVAALERDGVAVRSFVCVARADALALDARCLLYTSPSPRDRTRSRMPSSA